MPRPQLIDEMPGLHADLDYWWDLERKAAEKEKREPKYVNVFKAYHSNVYRKSNKGTRPSRTYVEHYLSTSYAVKGDASRIPAYEAWSPWKDKKETPEQVAFLLRLNMVTKIKFGKQLSTQTAAWACKLQPTLRGQPIFGQYSLINLYTHRENLAYYFQRKTTYTADLDALVAFQAWKLERQSVYLEAIELGIIPPPNFGEAEENIEPGAPVIDNTLGVGGDTTPLGLLPTDPVAQISWHLDILKNLLNFFLISGGFAGDVDHEDKVRNDLLIRFAAFKGMSEK